MGFLGKLKHNRKYPLTSFINYISIRICKVLGTEKVFGYPSKINLEPTNICNLKCPLCPTGLGINPRPKGVMSFEHFKQFIDEVKNFTIQLRLSGYGEPLINLDIFKMIKYASDAGLSVHLHTNVLLLDTEEKVYKLLESGLGAITISLDGYTQEIYQKYRIGGDVHTALANIKSLLEGKKALGNSKPVIRCQMVVTKRNEHEVEILRQTAMELGADSFTAKKANLALTNPNPYRELPDKMKEFYPTSAEFQRYQLSRGQVNTCSWLYKEAFICWDGDVLSCCFDVAGLNNMGNIFQFGSFYNVWNGPAYGQLRRQVNNDISKAIPLCNICPDRISIKDQ